MGSSKEAYELVEQHRRYHTPGCFDETCPICAHERGKREARLDNGESEHPCFREGEDDGDGRCMGDGWFRCHDCLDLSPDSPMLDGYYRGVEGDV